ncbi:MAG: hypothetical protein Q7S23_00540 [bacterium]|nr:hypothetical protein [bacterium]
MRFRNIEISKYRNIRDGSILVSTLVFSFIFLMIAGGLLGFVSQQRKLSLSRQAQLSALQIAEAGANYYRWHLAHAVNDYADGTGQTGCNPCGPYVHNVTDPSGTVLGSYSLLVTPPPQGSTIVKIKSSGSSIANPALRRHVVARYGRPSLAAFAVVADANLRFGLGTTVNGPLHSNYGIRFDGLAYNVVTSYQQTYTDTDSDACTASSWAVHTCVSPADPSPNTPTQTRLDVFAAGRQYPVPQVDFNAITVNLDQLQDLGNAPDGSYHNPSNQQGWHIQFLGNGTYRYRKVKTTRTCTYGDPEVTVAVGDVYAYQGNWATTALPANGIIFVEDNAWVDGTLQSGERITLIAAMEPLASGNATIWVNNDILYTVRDGTAALGLIAQKDISAGLFSEDNLEIDAALLAQTGRVGRPYYPSDCSPSYYLRDTITVYGSIATKQRYGFAWVCSGVPCSGYNIRNLNFDGTMTYTPPPSFPTSGEYRFISWEEVLSDEIY